MTFREASLEGARALTSGRVPTESPDLDARVLLGHAAGLDRAALFARWPELVPPAVEAAYRAALGRRAEGEPVAWITGVQEFLGMDFEVGPGLLVPRADTETLVEAAVSLFDQLPERPRVVDVATGTGCVAVGLAALAPRPAEVWAGDVSPLAVETAQRNADRLLVGGRTVRVVASDLLTGLAGPWDLIVSNPPYLTPAETQERVGPRGWREPALALDGGGGDGLDLIRSLVSQAYRSLAPGGWLVLEAAGPQMADLRAFLGRRGLASVRTWRDLGGVERVIAGQVSFESHFLPGRF